MGWIGSAVTSNSNQSVLAKCLGSKSATFAKGSKAAVVAAMGLMVESSLMSFINY